LFAYNKTKRRLSAALYYYNVVEKFSDTATAKDCNKRLNGLNKELITLNLAEKYADLPMPGYTHTRPAMVSTFGHYFAAIAETLSVDFEMVEAAFRVADRCPLGSAAGYGTSVDIDRKLTAKLLGFGELQINTLAAQLGRGQIEVAVLAALTNVGITLSRFVNDLIYFSTPEFDFLSLSDEIATSSSIMPQKKNPDPLEIIRATAGVLIGAHTQAASIVKGIPVGYQRDLQLIKAPFVQGVKLGKHSLQAVQIVLKNLEINEQAIEHAAQNTHLFAADIANELVLKKGLSFRDAYRKVKEGYEKAAWRGLVNYDEPLRLDPRKRIAAKKGIGMPGNLQLGVGRKWLFNHKKSINLATKKFEETLQKIWQL